MSLEYIKINNIEAEDKTYSYYEINESDFGLVFKVSPLDAEGWEGCENGYYESLRMLVESLPINTIFKVHYKSTLEFDPGSYKSRISFLEGGYRKIELYLSINFKTFSIPFFPKKSQKYRLKTITNFLKDVQLSPLMHDGMSIENIDPRECPFFEKNSSSVRLLDEVLIDKDSSEYINVIKLEGLSKGDENGEVEFTSLKEILTNFPLDGEVVATVKKLSQTVSEGNLKMQVKASGDPKNKTEEKKSDAKEEALKDVELYGQQMFKVDLAFLIRGTRKNYVIDQGNSLIRSLGQIGQFKRQLETSIFPYEATRVNSKTSSMQFERSPVIPFFLPLIHCSKREEGPKEGDIPFLRADYSLTKFNVNSSRRSFNNGILIGNTGKGKSVLTNLLINDLMKDEKNKIILLDVKTSHYALTKKHNGIVHEIDLEKSSGMSAFNLLKNSLEKSTISHVCDFVVSLCEGGDSFSDEESSQVSTTVNQYIKEFGKASSLFGFLEYIKNKSIPGKENLKRWGPEGLLSNVFSKEKIENNRFQYFDLKNIKNASKAYISKAVVNLVLTQFYKALQERERGERIFLVIDESPFFIKSCFSQLMEAAANVRSLGGRLVFMSQLHSQLLGPNGEDSLFRLSSWKIFMSVDGTRKEFKDVTRISDSNYEFLLHQNPKGSETRFYVLEDEGVQKQIGVRLSNKEYWESTTKDEDKDLIELIEKKFGLSELKARRAVESIYEISR
jgi:hypothetical protein